MYGRFTRVTAGRPTQFAVRRERVAANIPLSLAGNQYTGAAVNQGAQPHRRQLPCKPVERLLPAASSGAVVFMGRRIGTNP
jgi:hypothetical protein